MYKTFKWIMDRLLAFIALIVLSPLFLILAILVAVDSPGGPFIVQKREGYKRKTIKVIKFRSMLSEKYAKIQGGVVVNEEDRVTRMGHFLRRSKFDELPQLVNILKGDMSFVGPRPLCFVQKGGEEIPQRRESGAAQAVNFKQYKRWEFQKFSVLPGMTGLPQAMGNSFLTLEERSYYEVLYTEKQSLWLDLKIILRTIGVVLRGEKPYRKSPTAAEVSALIGRYQSPEGVTTVAEVIGNAKLGGVRSVVLNYLNHMDLEGLDVHIFTYGPSAVDAHFKEKGWTVHYLPNFIKFPLAMRAFKRELKERKYNIVHSHLTSLSLFPLKVAEKQGVEVRICHAHSTTDKREATAVVKNVFKRYSVHYATDLLACSRSAAKWMCGKNADECLILKNAIDLNAFSFDSTLRVEIRERLGLPNDTLVLGCVARICYQKNIPLLLKVLWEVNKKRDAHLLLIGTGKKENAVLRMAKRLGLSDKLHVVHETERPEPYYSAMDAFVLTSRYEGLGMVAIEAQANGLACFLSDAVPAEAAVGDKVAFLPQKAECFAQAILTTDLTRTDKTQALREAGYDIETQASVLRAYYDEVIHRANVRLRSKCYTMKIGGKRRTFYATADAPWALLRAIFATNYPVDKYFVGGALSIRELIADFQKDRPEDFRKMTENTGAVQEGETQ